MMMPVSYTHLHGVSRDEQRLLDITYVAATGQQHEYLVLALREAEGGGHITATVVQLSLIHI